MFHKKSFYEQIVYVRYFILVLGILITTYLIYVNNLSDSTLSCGNVGDCNKVQNSSYGFLLGVPVTFLGLLYFCFLAALYSNYFIRKKFATFSFMELIGFSEMKQSAMMDLIHIMKTQILSLVWLLLLQV